MGGVCKHFEGEGEEKVACENSCPFIKGFMKGGLASAEVVVVHGGEIIVDEGVGVDEFDGGGCIEALVACNGEEHLGAEAFSSGKKGVVASFLKGGIVYSR